MTDTERLDFLETWDSSEYLLKIGPTHYWRQGYGMPYLKADSLRDAVDKAVEAINAKGL